MERNMTTTPSSGDGSVGPEHFAGWPCTPPTERLEQAINLSRVSNLAVVQYYASRDDDEGEVERSLLRDLEMVLATQRNSTLAQRLDQERLEHIARSGDIAAFKDLLREHESDTDFCGGLVIDDSPDTDEDPWLIAFRHMFALSRDPHWMGLSPQLPHVKDLHVHVFESPTRPGRIGFFLGLPEKVMPVERRDPGPAPGGEPQLLAEIAAWHGARAFHWVPSTDNPGMIIT